MQRKIYTGAKFFRYLEGNISPEVIRVRNIDYKKDIVKYFDSEGNKKEMKYDFLSSNYRMLSPDGLMTFSIVSMGRDNDVIISLKKMPKTTEEYDKMDNIPYAVCRQMITDVYTNNMTKVDGLQYLGVSISKDTIPAGLDMNMILVCQDLLYTRFVAVYLDDCLDDILSLFDNASFDKVLNDINEKYSKDPVYRGLSTSLKELMEINNFMYDFRRCFNIIEIPFAVDEDSEGLDQYNLQFLEKELKINIMETYLIRYSKEINLNRFKRDYVLVTSSQEKLSKVYIVGYDKYDGEYIPRSIV